MSTFRNPVGPQSPKVYWRRRLLVGLGVLAVVVVVILILIRPGSGLPKAGAISPTTVGTTAPANATAATVCKASNLDLVAVADKPTYAAADQPKISMKLTNKGTADCTINLGSTKQVLTIKSGSETIWTSTDCQTAPVDSAQVIKAGETVVTPTIAWNRTRSAKSTCASTTLPQVTAGGASYHLGVALGDLKSKATVQFLLN